MMNCVISGPENFPPSDFDSGDEKNEKSPYIVQVEKDIKERSLEDSRGHMKELDKAYVAVSEKIVSEGISQKAALEEVDDSMSGYADGVMTMIEGEADKWVDNMPAERKEYLYNTTVADEIALRREEDPSLVRKAATELSDEQDLGTALRKSMLAWQLGIRLEGRIFMRKQSMLALGHIRLLIIPTG